MISDELLSLVADLLQVDPSTLNKDSQKERTPGWDSMMQCQIMTEIELEFDIEFTMEEMQEVSSLGAIQQLVNERLAK